MTFLPTWREMLWLVSLGVYLGGIGIHFTKAQEKQPSQEKENIPVFDTDNPVPKANFLEILSDKDKNASLLSDSPPLIPIKKSEEKPTASAEKKQTLPVNQKSLPFYKKYVPVPKGQSPNSIRLARSQVNPPVSAKKVSGRLVCAKKNDHPGKSDKNKFGHVDMECCLDPDEIPNPYCSY